MNYKIHMTQKELGRIRQVIPNILEELKIARENDDENKIKRLERMLRFYSDIETTLLNKIEYLSN